MTCLEIIPLSPWTPPIYRFLCQTWKKNGPTKVSNHLFRGIFDDISCWQIRASSHPKWKTSYSVIFICKICSKHYWKATFTIRLPKKWRLLDRMWSKYDLTSLPRSESQLKDSKWPYSSSRLLLNSGNSVLIQQISSQIDINYPTLKLIINEIIGSMLPDINSQLSDGMELPQKIWEVLAKYDISDLRSQTFLDFTAVGMKFDLWIGYYSLLIYPNLLYILLFEVTNWFK